MLSAALKNANATRAPSELHVFPDRNHEAIHGYGRCLRPPIKDNEACGWPANAARFMTGLGLLKTDEIVTIHNDRPMRTTTGEILDAHDGMLTTWPHLDDGLFYWYGTSYGPDCLIPPHGCCSNITACPANISSPSCGSCAWRNNKYELSHLFCATWYSRQQLTASRFVQLLLVYKPDDEAGQLELAPTLAAPAATRPRDRCAVLQTQGAVQHADASLCAVLQRPLGWHCSNAGRCHFENARWTLY